MLARLTTALLFYSPSGSVFLSHLPMARSLADDGAFQKPLGGPIMASVRKGGLRRGLETRWRDVIRRWQRSGLSQAAFCRQEKLKAYQLSHWKRKLLGLPRGPSRARRKPSLRSNAFVPVRVAHRMGTADPDANWSCEIRFSSGVIVRLRDDPSVQELWRLGTSGSVKGGEPCG